MKDLNLKTVLPYGILFFLVLYVIVVSVENPFFWDTVQLGSHHSTYYFQTNFESLVLPNRMDSGHIPAFGAYLAVVFMIFERSLLISHLAMVPFIIGIVWQLYQLVAHFFKKDDIAIVLLMVLVDPVILGQISLVSPDIPLTFFFLMGVNAILKNSKSWIIASVILLSLTSMRGMMISFCFFWIDILHNKGDFSYLNLKKLIPQALKRSLLYVPAFLLFLGFSVYHYQQVGWIGYHEDSPWIDSFERVDFIGFIRNLVIYAWRLLDFGRVIVWVIIAALILKYKIKLSGNKDFRFLWMATGIFFLLFPINMLWAANLLGHRYLIPLFLLLSISVAYLLFHSRLKNRHKNLLASLWIVVLFTGNFWIYPDKIAQGWDSTLAHLPYYDLYDDALDYFSDHQIDLDQVEGFFPTAGRIDDFKMNGDVRVIDGFEGTREYVIYSNVNNISDDQYDLIHGSRYAPVAQFSDLGVYITIYQKVNGEAL